MDTNQVMREVKDVMQKQNLRKYGEKQIHTVPELMKHMKNVTKGRNNPHTSVRSRKLSKIMGRNTRKGINADAVEFIILWREWH